MFVWSGTWPTGDVELGEVAMGWAATQLVTMERAAMEQTGGDATDNNAEGGDGADRWRRGQRLHDRWRGEGIGGAARSEAECKNGERIRINLTNS